MKIRMPIQEKINPAHTALIVIDAQVDFCSPEGLLGNDKDYSLYESVLSKLPKVISVAEKAGVLVLYTKQIYSRDKLNALQKEQYDLDGKLVLAVENTKGADFYKINPPMEKVFIKHNNNVFSNAELCEVLIKNSIKTLVLTGFDTVFCIETALRNAVDLGYKVVLPRDLVGMNAKRLDLHNQTLNIASYIGVVINSDELITIWENYLNN